MFPVFFGSLFLNQYQANAYNPPAVVKTDLFEEWYQKELSTRKILVLKDTALYTEQDEKSPVLAWLAPGTKINILGGNYYVSPTKVVVLEDHISKYGWQTITEYHFKAGEVFYIVDYLGEGIFTAWQDNETFKVDLRGIKGLSVYGKEPNYWGMLTEDPKWHLGKAWARIKTVEGQSGWVIWKNNFGNTMIDGYRGIYVFINGKYAEEFLGYGKKAYAREEGKILIPLDAAVDLIGATVAWNQDSTVATVNYQTIQLQIVPGKRIAVLNGNPINLEGIPNWKGTTFFVPIRAFYEALGGNVEWDESARQVSVIFK